MRLACHRGLGACIGTKFAAQGCNVAINYLTSEEQANTLATRLESEYGIKAVTVQGVGALELENMESGAEDVLIHIVT
jgi:NAD(P)-dependent dehydrogenase (short-subunit alcohol dehydrogenase family)